MNSRQSTSWQTALADLSLILFMVAALTVSRKHLEPSRAVPSLRGEAVAIWTGEDGAPPLADWIAEARSDPRQRLTITARYAPGQQAKALETARRLAAAAGRAGTDARIVVEPGSGEGQVELVFDRDTEATALK